MLQESFLFMSMLFKFQNIYLKKSFKFSLLIISDISNRIKWVSIILILKFYLVIFNI